MSSLSTETGRTLPGSVVPMSLKRADKRVKVAAISNFAPTQCGIATFAEDAVGSLARSCSVAVTKIPLVDRQAQSDGEFPSLQRDDPAAYGDLAQRLNRSDCDVVWLQHEYGIYGGEDGALVLTLIERLALPVVVTLHTVLEHPSEGQLRVVREIGQRASLVMVMSQHGRDLLATLYGIAHERIEVIEHGAPDRDFVEASVAKRRAGFAADQPVLATFGLLGPGKGIEQVIEALPAVILSHPGTVYKIIGATHPNLKAREGESYREGLDARAQELGVSGNIHWIDRFLHAAELLDELEACDIYLTPYPNLEQATSGTLSYAVALGKAVISTPYVHACELLADGVGRFFDHGDIAQLERQICRLLDSPQELSAIQQRAYSRGRRTTWERTGRRIEAMLKLAQVTVPETFPIRQIATQPVRLMTDRVGLIQHARFDVPDRRHGYALDDNARALILAARLAREGKSDLERDAPTFAAFVQDAWNKERCAFRNFLGFDLQWREDAGSEDSQGRAFWALGEVIASEPATVSRRWATALHDEVLPQMEELGSPRAMAFAMLGASRRLEREADHGASLELLARHAATLAMILDSARRPDWTWFEALLAYDNTRLSEALIEAGARLDRADLTAVGIETLEWISARQTGQRGQFRPIGTESFHRPGEVLPFDQQPLEALAFIEACAAAHRADGNATWRMRAHTAFQWYLGRNDRGIPLVDERLRCHDGLTPLGRNANSGAESVLAFPLAQLALRKLDLGDGQVIEEHESADDAADPPLVTYRHTPATAGS